MHIDKILKQIEKLETQQLGFLIKWIKIEIEARKEE